MSTTQRLMLLALVALMAAADATRMVEGGADVTNSTTAPTAAPGASPPCDAQLLFQKLYVLMPAINQCAKESDYFIKPSNLSLPSDASLAKYCDSKNCSLLSQELDNAGLPSCTVPVGNTTMSFKVFYKNIKDHCDSSSASNGSGPSTPSNSATYSIARWVALACVALAAIATA